MRSTKFHSRSWLPAAWATRAARTKSGLTFPGRTYCFTMPGSCVSAESRQNGHCRSANSVTWTGAPVVPSAVPFCGTPANSAVVALAPDTEPDDDAAVELDGAEPGCEAETAISTATI